MIGAEEVVNENNATQFQFQVLESMELGPKRNVGATDAVRAMPAYEINITGTQLLIGLASALCGVGLMVWAFLKLWLFE
jgi:hypothetical protein